MLYISQKKSFTSKSITNTSATSVRKSNGRLKAVIFVPPMSASMMCVHMITTEIKTFWKEKESIYEN